MNISISNRPYLSFQSTIKFVDERTFTNIFNSSGFEGYQDFFDSDDESFPKPDGYNPDRDIKRFCNYAPSPYKIERIAKSKDKEGNDKKCVCTKGAYSCNIAGVTNQNEAILAHIYPAGGISNKVESGLKGSIAKLKHKNNNLHALITGGSPIRESFQLFENLKKILVEDFKISTTIIWGQQGGIGMNTSTLYSVPDDTWYISVNYDEDSELRTFNINTADDLKNTFQYIDIADGTDGDKLYIGDKKIEPSEVNKKDIKLR